MVKFSLIVCNYNNGRFFQNCFDSITKQTHSNTEIIIIDDKSTDDSVQIIQNLIKDRPQFKFYQNEQNRGYAYTLRRGITLATGEIIARLDPDDAIAENALEECLKCYHSEKTVAAYSQIYMCDSDLRIKNIFANSNSVKSGNPKFFNIDFRVNHFFTFRRSAYDKTLGIDETLTSSVDQDLYMKLYETGDFHFIEKPFYFYRLHEQGISQNKSKKEKLNQNWDKVLRNTMKRRNITNLYGKPVCEIEKLPEYIFQKQNTFLKKLLRKFS